MLAKYGIALVFIALLASVSRAALKVADVPTFQLRARVALCGPGKEGKMPAKHTFRLGREAVATAEGTEWSDWIEFDRVEAYHALKAYPNLYSHAFPVVTRLQIDPATDPMKIDVELKLDGAREALQIKGDLFGPALGILVWRDEQNNAMAGSMADYNRSHYWRLLAKAVVPPERRAKAFPIVDRFIGGDDDRIDWREGVEALANAGFSAIMGPSTTRFRATLNDVGVPRTAGAVYSPPGYTFSNSANGGKEPMPLSQWAAQEAKPFFEAGYKPADMAWFGLADEPGWYYPAVFKMLEKPEARERFIGYLKSQGLTPADLGQTNWDHTTPLGRGGVKDLPTRRLFYWTARFFSWDSSRYMAESTAAMEHAFYPNLPLTTNWNFFSGRFYVPGPVANNADKKSPDAAMGGHDWFEFARMRGCTMLWTEDWFGDGSAYQWSFHCAKLRSAATKNKIRFGGYVVPRAAGDREDGLLQKMLCVAGSGGKAINNFVFGPEYNFPGNCYSQRPALLAKLAEANAMIGAAENLLLPGARPTPQVAILAPRSACAWDLQDQPVAHGISDATNTNLNAHTMDYMAETFDLYVALQHANVPVDFVDEDDLSRDGLANYKVLYLTEPNVPAERLHDIAAWVMNGGTLVTSSNAATADRYDQRIDQEGGLNGPLGVVDPAGERMFVANLSALPDIGKVKGAGGEVTAYGPKRPLKNIAGAVVATFADGSPASIRVNAYPSGDPHGKPGASYRFGWMPGLSYMRSATEKKDGLPVGFSPLLRDWICQPVKEAGVRLPVIADRAMVETPMLLSEQGAAITVLNWTGESIDKLTLHIRVPFSVGAAEAVRGGQLELQTQGDEVIVALPIKSADIVLLRPKAEPHARTGSLPN
ncbi:MAG TPA: beta-galactosidase trimerization domain-containing protein [Tepidisphaeraceae bacterium]|jgi:hypothetical protein|nr:beta-galactosidase trimerization domain-containing protein [Tepidisphaeraceae bacterium]